MSIADAWVRELKPVIVRCIQTQSVLLDLCSASVIDEVSESTIRELYNKGSPMDATAAMVEALLKSDCQEKWSIFLNALGKDYPHLKTWLESEVYCENERPANQIRKYLLTLATQVYVDDLMDVLYSVNVINEWDRDEIDSKRRASGNYNGMVMLLMRMQTHLEADQWYSKFLEALRPRYEHIIREMEAEFTIEGTCSTPGQMGAIKQEPTDMVTSDSCGQAVAAGKTSREIQVTGIKQEPADILSSPDSGNLANVTAVQPNLEAGNMIFPTQSGLNPSTKHTSLEDRVTSQTLYSRLPSSSVQSTSATVTDWEEGNSAPRLQLRTYQMELAEKAVQGQNTIISAETGTGKTWVALHIVEKHLSKPDNGSKRKVVFMANTGILIKQQATRFTEHFPQFRTKLITGDGDESRMVGAFLPYSDILCFTPQILVNNIDSGNIKSFCEFSLLILDECHHAVGNSGYASLTRRYLKEKEDMQTKGADVKQLPQIVGMTASVGVGNSKTYEEAVDHILRLCANLDARTLSLVEKNREEYEKYCASIEEKTIKMEPRDGDSSGLTILEEMENIETMLEGMALMQVVLTEHMQKKPKDRHSQGYISWTSKLSETAELYLKDNKTLRNIWSCARFLSIYSCALEVNTLLHTNSVIKYLARKHEQFTDGRDKLTDIEKNLYCRLLDVQRTLNSQTDKCNNTFVKTLTKELRKGSDLRVLVFVKARDTCRELAASLDKELDAFGIKTHYLYGKDMRSGIEGMREEDQTETVRLFREGVYNVLVCTSVALEGLDVPDCNMIINYSYSGSEITKIQMRGRSRKKNATHVQMAKQRQIDNDKINVYKIKMMYNAMAMFQKLDPGKINYKVNQYQRQEMKKYQSQVDLLRAKKSRKSRDDDFEVICEMCKIVVCLASSVYQLDHHHIVQDRELESKIERKKHGQPQRFGGVEKKFKMICKKCPNKWGIIAEKDGIDLKILKIETLKFRNVRTDEVLSPRKWEDLPYDFQVITFEDIPSIFGKESNPDAE